MALLLLLLLLMMWVWIWLVFQVEAIEQAKELDRYMQSTGKTKGPLHGLPLSIKDNLIVAGGDCTFGVSSNTLQPAECDGLLIATLRNAGAIPFTKTTVPQSLLVPETCSPVCHGAMCSAWSTVKQFEPSRLIWFGRVCTRAWL
jgi:Asp-tRNA(Asn)/Glu-tRNA(Gln) amidotransferase A subunit family amidase